jgi:hypothetical protein
VVRTQSDPPPKKKTETEKTAYLWHMLVYRTLHNLYSPTQILVSGTFLFLNFQYSKIHQFPFSYNKSIKETNSSDYQAVHKIYGRWYSFPKCVQKSYKYNLYTVKEWTGGAIFHITTVFVTGRCCSDYFKIISIYLWKWLKKEQECKKKITSIFNSFSINCSATKSNLL